MEKDKEKYKDVIWNTKPPTTAEIKLIIKRFKKGKAPGPDGITTDLIKDLNWEALEEIQKMIARWWREQKVPDTITLARVVSLYKKRGPRETRKLQTNKPAKHILQNHSSSGTKEAIKQHRPPPDENTVRIQKKQEHNRRAIRSKKNAGIRRKDRRTRSDDTTRLGKGIRQNIS